MPLRRKRLKRRKLKRKTAFLRTKAPVGGALLRKLKGMPNTHRKIKVI